MDQNAFFTFIMKLVNNIFFRNGVTIMKKFIVLSLILGVMGSTGLISKELSTDTNLSNTEIQQDQVVKLPVYSTTKIIWFF